MRARKTLNEPEPTLDEEISSLADDDVMDFINLSSGDTGVEGIIRLDTEMGHRGPRVKYFLKVERRAPSFSVSIAAEPRVLGNSLPEAVVQRVAADVIEWVKGNRKALLKFWEEGTYWTVDQVARFAGRSKKLPRA